jgi:hypothetical protein
MFFRSLSKEILEISNSTSKVCVSAVQVAVLAPDFSAVFSILALHIPHSPATLTELEYKISTLIKKEIDNHTSSQILVTDLITSAVTLLAGKWMFGDGNLSIMGMGNKMARKFANEKASEKFFLGKHAGSVFYKAFPVAPTKTQIYIATASIGVLLTVFSLAAAVLSDPLRKKLGLHHKKLNALLESLEEKIFLLVKAELKRETVRAAS